MTRLARAQVKVRQFREQRKTNKLRKLQLATNKSLRNAKHDEEIAAAQEKASKAKAKEAAAKRKKNAEQIKRNEKRLKSIKKFGKKFLKNVRK